MLLLSALSASAFATLALAQQALFINTPASLVECQPTLLNYGGGSGAPYFISALPAGQVSAAPILQLPQQSTTSYTWTVNLPAGTALSLQIRDSSGAVQYASPVTIQAGTSSACLDAAGASSASAVGAVSATSGAASAAAASSVAAPVATAMTLATSAASGSSLVSSASSATVTAAAGTPSSVPSTNGTAAAGQSYNFTCGAGEGDLTYGITTAVLDGVTLAQAVAYFGNWTAAVPGVITASNGTGVGASRTYTFGSNLTFSETLRLNMTNATTSSLHQQWNFSTVAEAVAISPSLIMNNAFNDLTVYTNTTSNQTSVQYFILACFSEQQAGLTTIASLIGETISYFANQLMGMNATMAASSTAPAAASTTMARRMVKLF